MRPKRRQPVSGDTLLADFQTVLTGMAMSQYAADEAVRSENQLMDQLAGLGNSGYLRPGTLAASNQGDITRDSLDVHVKKVQARQLAQLSSRQLNELVAQAGPKYVGRRVMVTPLEYKNTPIDGVWFDAQTGYRTGQLRKRKVIGIIEDVRLSENLLILRPTLQRRLMTPGLQNYLVYIVDPGSLTPMVRIDVL